MKPADVDPALFAQWEGAVAFRLFGDARLPTLTVPEQIAAQLGDRIIDGRLSPGARVGEQELADEFQVSRGPVRDAIRILEREGLVTILPRRGAVVTELSADELREIFEIRAALVETGVRRVAAERPPELIAVLRSGLLRLESLAEGEHDGDAYAETTYRLLLITTRFCGNRRLAQMLAALSLQTLRYSKLGLRSVERRRRSVKLWRQALVALERGDAERMTALSRQRIEESGEEAARQLAARETVR
ncbi:MAG: GntR family transcriptional regulator [Rubrivivax sp.]|nr:GntR family transcriptional regulator [Rubrivivax sp.]